MVITMANARAQHNALGPNYLEITGSNWIWLDDGPAGRGRSLQSHCHRPARIRACEIRRARPLTFPTAVPRRNAMTNTFQRPPRKMSAKRRRCPPLRAAQAKDRFNEMPRRWRPVVQVRHARKKKTTTPPPCRWHGIQNHYRSAWVENAEGGNEEGRGKGKKGGRDGRRRRKKKKKKKKNKEGRKEKTTKTKRKKQKTALLRDCAPVESDVTGAT